MVRTLLSIGVLQVLTILVGLLRAKGLAVLLGPAHFGVVGTIDQVVLTLVSLGGFSLTFTAVKFISRSHSMGQEPFQRTAASFLRAVGILAILTALVASAALAWNPGIFGADLARHHFVLQLALLGIPGLMLTILFVNTLAAAQRPAAAAGLNLLVASGLVVAAIVGVMLHGLIGLYVASVMFGVTALLACIVYLRRSLGIRLMGTSINLVRELRQSPEIISYSAYIYVVAAAYSLTLLATRYVVFSHLGEAPAGLLQASLSIALAVGAVLNPMSNLYLTPLVNRQISVTGKAHATHDFASKMLGLLLLGSLAAVLFPRLLVSVLYTRAFAAATASVFLFVLWQCIYQIVNVYQQLLIGLDDVLFMAVAATLGFGTAALLTPFLVPRLGLGGAALALALGMALYGGIAVARLRLRHRVAVPGRVFTRGLLVVSTVAIAGWLFGGGIGELSPRGLLSRGVFGLTAIALFWVLLDADERRDVRRVPGWLRERLRVRVVAAALHRDP